MKYYENILQVVGHTPLVKLNHVTDGLPVTLLAKVEYLNPGGSIKDRIGIVMIDHAEATGLLKPGGTIIEATAGNTGVGLALVAAVKGYRCIFVMPDKMSEDKINLLKAYGAEVVVTPTSVPPDSPDSYNGVADRLTREIPCAYRPHQFANQKNPETHFQTTGPEIWEDTDGKIDVLVAGMGTGGTISGTGKYLKEQNPSVLVIGADPEGSVLSGDSPKSYKVEGIGEDFIPVTFDRQVVDDMVRVSDAEAFHMARRLAREEGLLVGGSAGTAVVAALKYARRLEPGKVIVVILPDTGRNYLTKIFSDQWMLEHGFLNHTPEVATLGDILSTKQGYQGLISVDIWQPAVKALQLLEEYNISQLPVLDGSQVVGTVDETTLIKLLHDDEDLLSMTVGDIMGKPLPHIDVKTSILEPYRLLLAGYSGVIATLQDVPVGFLTRIDLAHYWAGKTNVSQEVV